MTHRPAGGRPKAVDIWEHVTELEGRRVKCKYCGLVFAASANRIKSHIYQIKGNGIRVCNGFPPPDNTGCNKRDNSELEDNLVDSRGLSTLDRPRDYRKLNDTMLDCYMSPKAMWEGFMIHSQAQQINTETQQRDRTQVGPFFVSKMVNACDLQLIQYVFDLPLDQLVFSSSGSFLNQSEFATIKPQTQLDSRKAALSGDVTSFIDFVERQNMIANYMSDVFDCEKNHEVQIWDSLSDQFINDKERDVTTHKLLIALNELFMDVILGSGWAFSKFQQRRANDTLLQPNPYDCGIFVTNFMQQSANYVNRNPLFQFESDEERLDLALKLLKSDLNKERETLYDKAAKSHNSQGENEQDSDLSGIKRKAYTELEDSDRRDGSNVSLEKESNLSSGVLEMSDTTIRRLPTSGSNLECTRSTDVSAQDLQGLKELDAISTNFCDIQEFNAYVRSFHGRDHILENYIFIVNEIDTYDFTNFCEFSSGKDSLKMVYFTGMKFGNTIVVLPKDINVLFINECRQLTTSLCHWLSFCEDNNPCEIERFEISRCDKLVYLCCVSANCPFCSSVQLVDRLRLWNLKDLQDIVSPLPPSWHPRTLFFHLKELNILGCNRMTTLLTPELLAQLQNVQSIYVTNCDSMKEIVSARSRDEFIFEMLLPESELHFEHTIIHPNLSSVWLENLPELNYVYAGIMFCPSLRSFNSSNCNKLIPPIIKKIPYGNVLQIKETQNGYSYWGK